jgi:hypothetical protein
MKLIFFLLISTFSSLYSFCQADKFFASFSTSIGFGGPHPDVHTAIMAAGYSDGDTPGSIYAPSLLLKAGMKIYKCHSLYLVFGQYDQAVVSGYKKLSYPATGNIPVYYWEGINVNLKTMQYGVGYQFEFSKSKWKLGVGPSVLVLDYKESKAERTVTTSREITTGASFSARIPFGDGNKPFGVEFVADLTLAPSVDLYSKSYCQQNSTLNARMTRGTIGLAFTYRNRKHNN